MANFLASASVTKAFAIAERHTSSDKWHVHVGFRYYRSYKSDYKWYKPAFDLAGFTAPALVIVAHDNLFGLIGGYCAKADIGDRNVLYVRGVEDSELEYGRNCYSEGLSRKRIRKFVDSHLVIGRSKFEAAIGAACVEFNCGESEAPDVLAQIGFTFADAEKGHIDTYKMVYNEKVKMGLLKVD
jgi:hypothetical protein